MMSIRSSARALMVALLLCTVLRSVRATETVKHSFTPNYAYGAYPIGQLVQSGSLFYGVTQYGIKGAGNIFSMTSSGAVNNLHEFGGGAGDGSNPNSGLLLIGGKFYGTTVNGGTNNLGVIFRMDTSGTLTILHTFTGYDASLPSNSDGSSPYAGLLSASDGKLYGTTRAGGVNNYGSVFSIAVDGTGYTLIHSFSNTASGNLYYPLTALTESGSGSTSLLYGATSSANGYYGGIYRLSKNGANYSVVHDFPASDPMGYYPYSDLIKANDNNIYGLCANGGANNFGTVFKIVPGSVDTLSTLWAFDGYTGAYPYPSYGNYSQNKLIQGADHNLYGVTQEGGANGWGTVFQLTLAGICTPLSSFSDSDSFSAPNPLVQSGANFYLTSYYGGMTAQVGVTNGYGAAMSVSSAGALSVIQSFYVRDSYNPYSSLVQVGTGTSAVFYGVTYNGGEFGGGAIFKVTASGAFSIIHHFNNYNQEGIKPIGGLLLYSDGKTLYGTTTQGGRYGYGTIFKVTAAGALTVIHHFQSREGYAPQSALVEGVGTDTTIYGACYSGGPPIGSPAGTIFSTDTTGAAFKVIHYFTSNSARGSNPTCQLLPDGLGNLYGATYQGGANNLGMVFKISTSGSAFTDALDFYHDALHNIYPLGYYPQYGGKMVLNGGFLYGSTQSGGTYNHGVIWTLNTATSAAAVLHNFNNNVLEGASPYGGIIYDSSSGSLYGTCSIGGAAGVGTVYRVNLSNGTFTRLHAFTGYSASNSGLSDGANPYGGVILASDGFLYGTTLSGGSSNYGAVFQQTIVP